MTKVSVLVAVYNAEQFLPECLDSLLRQTLPDIQVVCVDDGSTDGSLSLLHDYACRDTRIEVVHLDENGGQAHARNVGLQQASGEVVCMLDADDWLSDDALERMYEAFDAETDAVLFDVVSVYGRREEHYPMPLFESLTGHEAFRLSLTWQIHGLYGVRAAIHFEHPYDESCRAYSDDNTTRIHYLCSRRVKRCTGIYYYRQHASSVTHRVSVRRFDYLRANESMRWQMLELKVAHELLDLYENHRWLNLVDVYMFYHVHGSELTLTERRHGLQELYHVWATIDRRALQKKTTAKFGYRPCRSWRLFRLQEWLYFTLRGLLGRNY
jgi:glycosyltransferase involved in cell wall biosynthesis